MKVAVLGGTGFIGSHVVEKLVSGGHAVSVLSRGRLQPAYGLPRQAEVWTGDITDVAALSEFIEGADVVVHCVSSTVPSTSSLDPVGDVERNLIPMIRLLKLMEKKGMRRIVYFSSGGTVYGNPADDTHAFSERDTLLPLSSYGIVKAAIEHHLRMGQAHGKLDPIILRASNPYGPGQGHSGVQGLVGTMLDKIRKKETLKIWGDGGAIRDYVYAADLASLTLAAVESDRTGVFNAGSGIGYSVNEVLHAVRSLTGAELPVEHLPARGFDVKRVVLDMQKAQDAFGWKPTTTLNDGIAQTWAWLNRNAIHP